MNFSGDVLCIHTSLDTTRAENKAWYSGYIYIHVKWKNKNLATLTTNNDIPKEKAEEWKKGD